MSLRRISALIAALAITLACVVPMARLLGQSSPPPRSAPAPATPAKESGLVLDSNCTSDPPGFVVTWETDAETLKDKLLAGTPPAGVTITGWSITPDPEDIGTNETIGYYEDFDVTDGTNSLSVPDGVILTTGTLVDGNDNHANYCNDVDAFTGESSDYGDEDVAAWSLAIS